MDIPKTIAEIETTDPAKCKVMYFHCIGCSSAVRLTTVYKGFESEWSERENTTQSDFDKLNYRKPLVYNTAEPTKHVLLDYVICEECIGPSYYPGDEDPELTDRLMDMTLKYGRAKREFLDNTWAYERIKRMHPNDPLFTRIIVRDQVELITGARRYVTEACYIDMVSGYGVEKCTEKSELMIAHHVRKFGLQVHVIEGRFIAKPGYPEVMWMKC